MQYLANTDDTVVGKAEPYALHYSAAVERTADRDVKPDNRMPRMLDLLRCLEFHRARISCDRELTRAKMIAMDAQLGELDPIIKSMRDILEP